MVTCLFKWRQFSVLPLYVNSCYNSAKQLINHKGGFKNKRTLEENLRAIEIVELAVQNVELQTDLRDVVLPTIMLSMVKTKYKECGFLCSYWKSL